MFLRNSESNGSFWHSIPMFSGGSRYVNTHPVLRSSSKFDVLKNSPSVGHPNSILPSVVSSGSLSFIRSPTLVLQKSGTYQSRAMVPCFHTNSLIVSSLVLCNSTVGFMTGFGAPCNCSVSASLSMHCVIALVWTPALLSVDIPVHGCLFFFLLSIAVLYLYFLVSLCVSKPFSVRVQTIISLRSNFWMFTPRSPTSECSFLEKFFYFFRLVFC